jgi:hypothetical protein
MQLVDSKLYIANMPTDEAAIRRIAGRRAIAGQNGRLLSQLKRTTTSERLLALLLVGLLVAASPTLLNTVRSVVSVALQILLEAGHAGLIAFQIFGR